MAFRLATALDTAAGLAEDVGTAESDGASVSVCGPVGDSAGPGLDTRIGTRFTRIPCIGVGPDTATTDIRLATRTDMIRMDITTIPTMIVLRIPHRTTTTPTRIQAP